MKSVRSVGLTVTLRWLVGSLADSLVAPLVVASVLAATALPVQAQFDNVGSIDFPTSSSGEVEQHFLRGVAVLHSFGWNQAVDQFKAAQEIDPDFAMAYWGESLAYNHPLVSQMNADEPRRVLQKLAPTAEERAAKAPTEREKGFLRAVEVLWGEGDHVNRRVGYMESMEQLHEQYPDDSEVAAFYALSILSAVAATGDLGMRLKVKAGTIALELFSDNPDHPGAPHYAIHSFDDPDHAPLALESAYRFSEIAPAVAHAIHMPTHIFIQHGMWDLVSGNNQTAYDAARALWDPGESLGDAIHPLDWGQYGDLQLGDYAKARLWIERIEAMSGEGGFLEGGARGQAGTARARNTTSLLKSRYIVETEEWEVRPITADLSANELLAIALSAARLGDQATLREAEAALGRAGGGRTEIMHKQAGALLHAGMGHAGVATGLMDEAQTAIDALAPPRGSASPIKPVYELYGEILLDLDQPDNAIEKFETSLLRMPNRPRSLLGLARAHVAAGNVHEAAEAYQRLMKVWAGRESFEGYQEAMRYLEGAH
ncbi:MAG TPA: tetratricopeptide repeat protein [Gemmatimonadetes bacterium]|nr:tetratricopeptide repeat protein [Gemmatimonadota bacterium]